MFIAYVRGVILYFPLRTSNLHQTENDEIDGDHLGSLDGDHLGVAQTGGHDQRSHGASWQSAGLQRRPREFFEPGKKRVNSAFEQMYAFD